MFNELNAQLKTIRGRTYDYESALDKNVRDMADDAYYQGMYYGTKVSLLSNFVVAISIRKSDSAVPMTEAEAIRAVRDDNLRGYLSKCAEANRDGNKAGVDAFLSFMALIEKTLLEG